MLLTTFALEHDNPEDDFSENLSEILDQVESAEPAKDEGEKMAQRIWDKIMEQLPIENQQNISQHIPRKSESDI